MRAVPRGCGARSGNAQEVRAEFPWTLHIVPQADRHLLTPTSCPRYSNRWPGESWMCDRLYCRRREPRADCCPKQLPSAIALEKERLPPPQAIALTPEDAFCATVLVERFVALSHQRLR